MVNDIQKLTTITYHYVRDLENTDYPEIKGLTVSKFIYQLEFLKKHFTIISADDLVDFIKNGTRMPKNACLLTFDDGYLDHFLEVFPILVENNLSGLFFPCVKCSEESTALDVNKIHSILACADDQQELMNTVVDLIGLYSDQKLIETLRNKFYKAGRYDTAEVVFIKRCLQTGLPNELRTRLVNELFRQYVPDSEKKFCKKWYMSKAQMRAMIKAGMHFGAHGYEHVWLGNSTIDVQTKEIEKSITFLESLFRSKVDATFCYPYGSYNENTISLLRENEFVAAFTTEPQVSTLERNNLLTLMRFDTNDFPQQ